MIDLTASAAQLFIEPRHAKSIKRGSKAHPAASPKGLTIYEVLTTAFVSLYSVSNSASIVSTHWKIY